MIGRTPILVALQRSMAMLTGEARLLVSDEYNRLLKKKAIDFHDEQRAYRIMREAHSRDFSQGMDRLERKVNKVALFALYLLLFKIL